MKLSGRDNLCELLHVGWLDVDNCKTFVLNVEVPKIDAQVIATYECLSIAVDRYAVDVICVSVGIGLPGYGGDNGIMMSKTGHLEISSRSKIMVSVPHWYTCAMTARCKFSGQVVLGHHFE